MKISNADTKYFSGAQIESVFQPKFPTLDITLTSKKLADAINDSPEMRNLSAVLANSKGKTSVRDLIFNDSCRWKHYGVDNAKFENMTRELSAVPNDIFNPAYTTAIDSKIRQILPELANSGNYMGLEIIPFKEERAASIVIAKQSLTTGFTQERIYGQPLPRIDASGRTFDKMSFGAYGEAFELGEQDAMFMSMLGSMDLAGTSDYIAQQAMKLTLRRSNLANKQIWDMLDSGTVKYQGKQANFGAGIPINTPAPWFAYNRTTRIFTVNQAFDILSWLRNLWLTDMRVAAIKPFVKRIIVTPFAMAAILGNQYTRSLVMGYNANNSIFNSGNAFDANAIAQLAIPGLPPIVANSESYTANTDVNADYTEALESTRLFMPEDMVYFDCDFSSQGAAMGNFALQSNIDVGGILNPQPAVSFKMQDMSAISADTRYLLVSSTFNGNPFLRFGAYRVSFRVGVITN